MLGATEAQLRERRAGDPTRSRRHFEKHLALVGPQVRYFAALAAAVRVLRLDTGAREALAGAVLAAVAGLPSVPPDSVDLLDRMAEWVRTHAPAGSPPA